MTTSPKYLGKWLGSIYLAGFVSLGQTAAAKQTSNLISEGIEAYKAGHYELAIEKLSAALKEDPKNPITYNDRALVFKAKKDYPRAIADFSAALQLKPDWFLYYNRATAYSDQGNEAAAVEDYTKALKKVPKHSVGESDCLLGRAHSYFNLEQAEPALRDVNAVIKLEPKEADPYVLRGILHKVRHDYGKSLADYEKAISLEPSEARSYDVEAYLLSVCPMPKYRDGRKALGYATKACDLTEWKNAGYLETLAAAYAENRQFDEAVKWQQKAMEMDRESDKTRLKLYQQKKPFRDLNRKETAFPEISDLPDKVAIRIGQELTVLFKVSNDQVLDPKVIPGNRRLTNALSLKFEQEKRGRTLRLTHSFRRTMVARCLARLKDCDAYFETDILPVPVRTINPELWSDPIEELVLFDFKLTGPETPPENPEDDDAAGVAVELRNRPRFLFDGAIADRVSGRRFD